MFQFIASAWINRALVLRLAKREVEARYKGSMLGLLWAALLPLIMIGIYSFVFSSVMRSRWVVSPTQGEVPYDFAMLLFAGFILFTLFSETVSRAPGLMLENPAYIKKILFPLDTLPWIATIGASISAGIAFCVFIILYLFLYGLPPVTIFLLPLIVLPIFFLTLGATYLLSCLGVFLRDLRQLTPLVTTAMLFLSPVLYPLEAVPEAFRPLINLNPMTIGVVQARQVIFWGEVPNFGLLGIYTLCTFALASIGCMCFNRVKKAFADVI